MTLPTDVVFEDIRAERDQHVGHGYDAQYHAADLLIAIANHHIARADHRMGNPAARRIELVKAAAMLATAIENLDRNASSEGQ
jgi:hypothetical protein